MIDKEALEDNSPIAGKRSKADVTARLAMTAQWPPTERQEHLLKEILYALLDLKGK